jgi:hypothetical protein
MRLYVAGRIANENGYREKFATACDEVRTMGHEPVNPCEIDHSCHNRSWEEFMIADIREMLDCDGVYALSDWSNSKGATIEVELAMKLNKVIIYQAQIHSTQQPT